MFDLLECQPISNRDLKLDFLLVAWCENTSQNWRGHLGRGQFSFVTIDSSGFCGQD